MLNFKVTYQGKDSPSLATHHFSFSPDELPSFSSFTEEINTTFGLPTESFKVLLEDTRSTTDSEVVDSQHHWEMALESALEAHVDPVELKLVDVAELPTIAVDSTPTSTDNVSPPSPLPAPSPPKDGSDAGSTGDSEQTRSWGVCESTTSSDEPVIVNKEDAKSVGSASVDGEDSPFITSGPTSPTTTNDTLLPLIDTAVEADDELGSDTETEQTPGGDSSAPGNNSPSFHDNINFASTVSSLTLDDDDEVETEGEPAKQAGPGGVVTLAAATPLPSDTESVTTIQAEAETDGIPTETDGVPTVQVEEVDAAPPIQVEAVPATTPADVDAATAPRVVAVPLLDTAELRPPTQDAMFASPVDLNTPSRRRAAVIWPENEGANVHTDSESETEVAFRRTPRQPHRRRHVSRDRRIAPPRRPNPSPAPPPDLLARASHRGPRNAPPILTGPVPTPGTFGHRGPPPPSDARTRPPPPRSTARTMPPPQVQLPPRPAALTPTELIAHIRNQVARDPSFFYAVRGVLAEYEEVTHARVQTVQDNLPRPPPVIKERVSSDPPAPVRAPAATESEGEALARRQRMARRATEGHMVRVSVPHRVVDEHTRQFSGRNHATDGQSKQAGISSSSRLVTPSQAPDAALRRRHLTMPALSRTPAAIERFSRPISIAAPSAPAINMRGSQGIMVPPHPGVDPQRSAATAARQPAAAHPRVANEALRQPKRHVSDGPRQPSAAPRRSNVKMPQAFLPRSQSLIDAEKDRMAHPHQVSPRRGQPTRRHTWDDTDSPPPNAPRDSRRPQLIKQAKRSPAEPPARTIVSGNENRRPPTSSAQHSERLRRRHSEEDLPIRGRGIREVGKKSSQPEEKKKAKRAATYGVWQAAQVVSYDFDDFA